MEEQKSKIQAMVRLNDDDAAILGGAADAAGLPLATWLRAVALNVAKKSAENAPAVVMARADSDAQVALLAQSRAQTDQAIKIADGLNRHVERLRTELARVRELSLGRVQELAVRAARWEREADELQDVVAEHGRQTRELVQKIKADPGQAVALVNVLPAEFLMPDRYQNVNLDIRRERREAAERSVAEGVAEFRAALDAAGETQ